MNKKQLIVTWTMGLLLCIGLVLSTYAIWYDENPNTLDSLLSDTPIAVSGKWRISRLEGMDRVAVNVIRYISPVLIIGSLLLYSLRSKSKT